MLGVCSEQMRMLEILLGMCIVVYDPCVHVQPKHFQTTSMMDDHYSVLGCDQNSTTEQIRQQYKKLALQVCIVSIFRR